MCKFTVSTCMVEIKSTVAKGRVWGHHVQAINNQLVIRLSNYVFKCPLKGHNDINIFMRILILLGNKCCIEITGFNMKVYIWFLVNVLFYIMILDVPCKTRIKNWNIGIYIPCSDNF